MFFKQRKKQAFNDKQLEITRQNKKDILSTNKSNKDSQISIQLTEYEEEEEPEDDFEGLEERHHARFAELATLC